MDDEQRIVEMAITSSPVKRLASFLRSVTPDDPYQLVFLLGVIFLFISPRLSWWQPRNASGAFEGTLHSDATDELRTIFSTAVWPIMIASLVGYYTCFWAGARLIRRLLLGVLFPAAIGMSLMLYGLLSILAVPPFASRYAVQRD
jgi:hypothetical protein